MHTQSLSRPRGRSWIHNYLIAFQLGSERSTQQTEKNRRRAAGTTGINMVWLMHAVMVFVTTKGKENFLRLMLLLWHFRSRTPIPNYIVKTQPCCHRRGSVTKSEGGGRFETFDMADHLPSRVYFGFGWITIFVKKRPKWQGHQWLIQLEVFARAGGLWERGTPISKK